jgi:hypothetical protein
MSFAFRSAIFSLINDMAVSSLNLLASISMNDGNGNEAYKFCNYSVINITSNPQKAIKS